MNTQAGYSFPPLTQFSFIRTASLNHKYDHKAALQTCIISGGPFEMDKCFPNEGGEETPLRRHEEGTSRGTEFKRKPILFWVPPDSAIYKPSLFSETQLWNQELVRF